MDPGQISLEDRRRGAIERNESALENGFYVRGVESAKTNFAQWNNTRIIQGNVPETLDQVESPEIAYLHLDMNCTPPEVAALNGFWDRLLPGAIVLFDDYAFRGCESQKHAMDAIGDGLGVKVASLPTGQGLLIKPPERKDRGR
jgi:hypothetical protein